MTARTLVLTALLSVALASPASAADFNVTLLTDDGDGTCDATCTVRDAVDDAGPADNVNVPAGTYLLTDGPLDPQRRQRAGDQPSDDDDLRGRHRPGLQRPVGRQLDSSA